MHTLVKIKAFRICLWLTYPIALLFLYPFALAKKKNKTGLFFFFDRYAMGGAQRVHLDILESVKDTYKEVYFTRLSLNDIMRELFYNVPNTKNRDIHFWCDNLLFRLFSVHYYSFFINRHKNAHVFSSNSTFFYDMLPFINKHVIKSELLHNFTYGKKGMEFFGLGNHKYLNNRLCVDYHTCNNIKNQYKAYKIPEFYSNRIKVIEPGVDIPTVYEKTIKSSFNILYAGRGGPQKRIALLDKIARECILQGWPVSFHFAGTIADELSDYVKEHSTLYGEVKEKAKMNELYEHANAILMTSAFEGFPMLIKEAMAYGCVPVVTALEGNKTHLTHLENALLIENVEDEEAVVNQGIECLHQLIENNVLYRSLSANAYQYAKDHFDKQSFISAYSALLASNQ